MEKHLGPFLDNPVVKVSANTFQWKCPRCHKRNNEGDSTCLKCGQDVEIEEPKMKNLQLVIMGQPLELMTSHEVILNALMTLESGLPMVSLVVVHHQGKRFFSKPKIRYMKFQTFFKFHVLFDDGIFGNARTSEVNKIFDSFGSDSLESAK